jgi:membrane protein YqaA with SNARE-associated domain
VGILSGAPLLAAPLHLALGDAVMGDIAVFAGLFLSAFLSATILPGQSEAALVALLVAKSYSVVFLLAVASLGNIFGSVANWLLGRGIERFRGRRFFPVSEEALRRAEGHYARWGYWSLLLSFAPVIGDPLTVIAGVLREPCWRFVVLVSISKIGRYLALAWLTLRWTA